MTLGISSAFDGGNIRLLGIDGDSVSLEIVTDHQSGFYQWFYFRTIGGAGRMLRFEIGNASKSAYPFGWPGYRVCWSDDRETWRRCDTEYDGETLRFRFTPAGNSTWFAYFAPYSMERHHGLVARMATKAGVTVGSLGRTIDGQEVDYLVMGAGERQVWLYARQHPGETMAEWWMEGALEALTDAANPTARFLLERATFHFIPNMNPDGSRRGHLRTNAAGINLNREWHAPTIEKSPEVFHTLRRMDETGVDFAMDVHGDEAIPQVFLAGFNGIPSWTDRQGELYRRYAEALVRRSPDFQIAKGYPVAKPGEANLSMSTNQLAERFGCVAMTLEMPFKDNDDLPDPEFGWSPARSKALGAACLDALLAVVDELR